ncbi:DUF2062 domain-containing protein [Nevskia sp.]|uniref:DUF2062 domain-containing protein n=1 Tax=Nevskia sp. TaxID=1929292 RepID=UPI0025D759F5|nr:DUF2062 domain-containing protein [Nevskia sp.]
MSDTPTLAPPSTGSVWQRKVVTPILDQLRQGITPEKIALTAALGAVIAVFPILGSTTLLCALVAFRLKLNQPIIQLVNYLCYPLQFALLLPFYRAGEWFGAPHVNLSIPEMLERFQAGPMQFIADFGLVALGGVAAWCVAAPFAIAALYYGLRPVFRAMALRTLRTAA